MKIKALAGVVALLVIFGCGGGGSNVSNGGGGDGTPPTGRLGATVLLNKIDANTGNPLGFVDLWFLPGQGRAPGDVSAGIRRVPLVDTNGDFLDDLLKLPAEKQLKLNDFNAQKIDFAVALNPNDPAASRSCTDMVLRIESLTVVDETGSANRYVGELGDPLFERIYPGELALTVLPGRYTVLQTFLNDAILNHNGIDVVFDEDLFKQLNINPETNKFTGFFADYVSFDIKGVADRPLLSSEVAAGRPAAKVFLSGDNYALSVEKPFDSSSSNPTSGLFEVLTPFGHLQGIYRPFEPLVGRKLYEIQQADPRDFSFDGPIHLITALKGYYRDYTEVLADMTDHEMLSFPKTGDGAMQEMVLVQRDVTKADAPITAMWFGEVDFGKTAGKGKPAPTIRMWPIAQLSPASVANQVNGVIDANSMTDSYGLPVDTSVPNWWRRVRAATYRVTDAPAGFPAELMVGRTTVFRL